MPPEARLLVVRERPFDVVEAELDELLTADHGKCPGTVTPAVRWFISREVSRSYLISSIFEAT
jgi:hypothetical protein